VEKIAAIARVTVQEAFREKLAVNLLVFALGLLAASLAISSLTFGEQYRIIVDLGLSAMEVFGTLIAVFLGSALVAREVERRTLYPVLAKPVSRTEYLVGRYLGLVVTTTANLLVMAAVFSAVLAIYTKGLGFFHDSPFLAVLGATAVRLAVVGAISVLFSTFSTTTLAAIFSLSLVVAGHLSSDLVRYWAPKNEIAGLVGRAAYVLVPNLEALNIKEAMVYRDPVPASFLLTGIGYGLLYAVAAVSFAAAIFARRDLR
jgi:Cu-processing system permease protein